MLHFEKNVSGRWPTFGPFSRYKMYNTCINRIKHIQYIGKFALYTSNMQ